MIYWPVNLLFIVGAVNSTITEHVSGFNCVMSRRRREDEMSGCLLMRM